MIFPGGCLLASLTWHAGVLTTAACFQIDSTRAALTDWTRTQREAFEAAVQQPSFATLPVPLTTSSFADDEDDADPVPALRRLFPPHFPYLCRLADARDCSILSSSRRQSPTRKLRTTPVLLQSAKP